MLVVGLVSSFRSVDVIFIVPLSIEFRFCCVVNAIASVVGCVEDFVGINVSVTLLEVGAVIGLSLLSPILLLKFELAFLFAGVVSNVLSSSGV